MTIFKKVGLIVGMVVLAYFGAAVFTNPAGVQAAMSDPWEAIKDLTSRIVELERRVTNIEQFLSMGSGEQLEEEEPVKVDEADYPYSAILAPELQGKIEARYNSYVGWVFLPPELDPRTRAFKEQQMLPGEGIIVKGFIKNVSKETISLKIWGRTNIRDANSGEMLLEGGWGGSLAPLVLKPNQVVSTLPGSSYEFAPSSLSDVFSDPKSLFVEVELKAVE
ncbi:MAG: hypothetical protein ISS52_05370 [Dehalococcoidia bacterium]|nr:hypothetical protein [Dehalococcoidia bacterium]